MLFSAKFSDLECRKNGDKEFFIAHSSSFDKTGILFSTPKDDTLSNLVKSFALPENKERLGEYEFKISFRSFKGKDGSFKNYFNLVGIVPLNSAD